MDDSAAIEIMSALAQPTRLEAFRLIMRHEPHGIAAGEVARILNLPQNTVSSHLSCLARAGLVSTERHGRSIIYRGQSATIGALTTHLVQDCCGGRPELCVPLIETMTACCTPGAQDGC